MKNILIIGSEGYLGTKLGNYLKQKNFNCVGYDIGFFKNCKIIDKVNFNSKKKDGRLINDNDILGFDVVILLAAISNDPFKDLNVDKIYNPTKIFAQKIALICKNLRIKFIFSSSCSVYGISNDIMFEDGPTNPQTYYSSNKVQIEEELSKLSGNGFSPIALRLATIFGFSPRIRFDIVINMLCGQAISYNKIMLNSDGQAWRPHLYIDDACEAFKCCIDWNVDNGKLNIFNVGKNENNMKIIEVAKIISHLHNDCEIDYLNKNKNIKNFDILKNQHIKDNVDKRTYIINFDKIHNELPNFKCKWTIEKGIKKLLHQLQIINLNKDIFENKMFYRLQYIKYLFKNLSIDKNLFWK